MTYRYLALGDSYTIGEGVQPSERWPAQLTRLLRESGVAIHDPWIIARTGWRTSELALALDAEAPAGPFDLVSLLIGVNDQYRGGAVDAYRSEFRHLFENAIALAGGLAARVVVLSIPDWGVTPFASGERRDPARIEREIEAFNSVSASEAASRGAAYVDVTPSSRGVQEDGGLLASDGLHPSGRLYAIWAALALAPALAALRV